MRVLILSNMRPDEAHPERGRFVRDQVDALREIEGLEVELCEIAPGASSLLRALPQLRRRFASETFDVVHSHFSLTAIPALAVKAKIRGLTLHGTDVTHPRTRQVTRLVLPLMDLVVVVSEPLAKELPGRASRRAKVLPVGVDVGRFKRIDRARARAQLGLAKEGPRLLFPADPMRPSKRHDLALQLAKAAGVPLMTLGGVDPETVPAMVNACNAVILPSEREGFGLAVLEALACDVPVLATPVGVHPRVLAGVEGCLCAPFELGAWLSAVRPHLEDPDPRIAGRARAEELSTQRMAQLLAELWRASAR